MKIHAKRCWVLGASFGAIACATGETLQRPSGDNDFRTGGVGNSGADAAAGSSGMPSGGGSATGGMTATGGNGGNGGTSGQGGASGTGGNVASDCENPAQKRCGTLCVDRTPEVGCSLGECAPCPEVTNGESVCNGTQCDADCDDGFVAVGGVCIRSDGGIGTGGAGGTADADGGGGTGTGGMGPGGDGGGTSTGGMGTGGMGPVAVVDFGYAPSNFDPTDSAISVDGLGATVLDCGTSTFNSETLAFGNWCNLPTPTPVVTTDGYVVVPLNELTIASGATLDVTGNRPVIFAVYGNATIAGTIDASAEGATPGPGGNVACGGSAGTNGEVDSGGGGGGFATAGGQGGLGDNGNTTAAGAPRGMPELVPLLGGCPGGSGSDGAFGGGGGGAVQLSASAALNVSGTISANGGNGQNENSNDEGGGGGGSGGAILLEGGTVVTPGTLTARGGNGGDGDNTDGGTGGTQTNPPQAGESDSTDGGGGGGGSAGRVHINSAE